MSENQMLKQKTKLTYKDYELFPDNGKVHQLINGEHYMTPSPFTRHQWISGNMVLYFRNYLEANPVGYVFYAPLDVVFSDYDIVQPDIIYVSREKKEIIGEKHIKGVPDLLIEILSKSTENIDKKLKKDLYAQYGVPEYWIVDSETDIVLCYALKEGKYELLRSYTRHETIDTALIPGLEIKLDKVFGYTD